MIAERGHPAQIDLVRAGDDRRPVAGSGGIRLGEPEIDVLVIGQDPQFPVGGVGRIGAVGNPARDEDGLGRRIHGGNEANLGRAVVASGDEDQAPVVAPPDADGKARILGLLVEGDVFLQRRAEPVESRPVASPIVVDLGEDQPGAVGRPDGRPDPDNCDGLQILARSEVADPELEPFRPVVVDHRREKATVGAGLDRAEPEIFMPLGRGRLVEDELVRAARFGPAIPFAILGAGLERPPIEIVAVLDRHRPVVFLDPAFHLLDQFVDEPLVGRHRRFEISVFGLQIVVHLGALDLRIAGIAEPGPGILDRHSVAFVAERALLGDGRCGQSGHPSLPVGSWLVYRASHRAMRAKMNSAFRALPG